MTCVENGIKPFKVDMDAIREGFRLAFPYVDLSEENEWMDGDQVDSLLLEDL